MNKDLRRQKRALKAEGYDGKTAKRMVQAGESAPTTTVYMKNGGLVPTSKRKTRHRGKTTHGGYGNGI